MISAERDGRYLMAVGAVHNFPIDTALQLGATEIIEFDPFDLVEVSPRMNRSSDVFIKLDKTVENHLAQLEKELADARGIPVRRIVLTGEKPVPLWDFRQSVELIDRDYKLACQVISFWSPDVQPSWWICSGIKSMLKDLLEVM